MLCSQTWREWLRKALLKDDCHLTEASCHRGCHLAPADPNRTSVGSEKTYYATECRV